MEVDNPLWWPWAPVWEVHLIQDHPPPFLLSTRPARHSLACLSFTPELPLSTNGFRRTTMGYAFFQGLRFLPGTSRSRVWPESVTQSVQLLSRVRLFMAPWTAARQASLSITNSWRLLKLMSIASVMPFNRLILCRPLLLLLSIFPSITVFSNESVLPIRWPKVK